MAEKQSIPSLSFSEYFALPKGKRITLRNAHAARPSGLHWVNEQKSDVAEYAIRNPWVQQALGPSPHVTVIEGEEGAIAFVFFRTSGPASQMSS